MRAVGEAANRDAHYADFSTGWLVVLSVWQQRVWPEVQRELDRIVQRLRALDPQRIVLFGSFARGDFHQGSDIDLMVILDMEERFLDRLGRVLAAVDPDQFDIEPHVYTPAEYETLKRQRSVLVEAAETEGKVLYERRTGGQQRWKEAGRRMQPPSLLGRGQGEGSNGLP